MSGGAGSDTLKPTRCRSQQRWVGPGLRRGRRRGIGWRGRGRQRRPRDADRLDDADGDRLVGLRLPAPDRHQLVAPVADIGHERRERRFPQAAGHHDRRSAQPVEREPLRLLALAQRAIGRRVAGREMGRRHQLDADVRAVDQGRIEFGRGVRRAAEALRQRHGQRLAAGGALRSRRRRWRRGRARGRRAERPAGEHRGQALEGAPAAHAAL